MFSSSLRSKKTMSLKKIRSQMENSAEALRGSGGADSFVQFPHFLFLFFLLDYYGNEGGYGLVVEHVLAKDETGVRFSLPASW